MAVDTQDTTTINLSNDVTINGTKYRAGRGVTVPKAQADNISEIDYTHQQYQNNLVKQRNFVAPVGTNII
jgi:hypothetical protein